MGKTSPLLTIDKDDEIYDTSITSETHPLLEKDVASEDIVSDSGAPCSSSADVPMGSPRTEMRDIRTRAGRLSPRVCGRMPHWKPRVVPANRSLSYGAGDPQRSTEDSLLVEKDELIDLIPSRTGHDDHDANSFVTHESKSMALVDVEASHEIKRAEDGETHLGYSSHEFNRATPDLEFTSTSAADMVTAEDWAGDVCTFPKVDLNVAPHQGERCVENGVMISLARSAKSGRPGGALHVSTTSPDMSRGYVWKPSLRRL